MQGWKAIAAFFLACSAWLAPTVSEVQALDYWLEWNFDEPIGFQSPSEVSARDLLIYDASSGSLRYQVGERTGERWSPPDLVSASGAFFTEQQLPVVPLATHIPFLPFLDLGRPSFEFDETIAGNVVAGSNSIRIRYDNYQFWPLTPTDPAILASWGLDALPTSYDYGEVLPAGLSEEFLRSDLYAAAANVNGSHVELVYVVPEPSALLIAAAALGLAGCRSASVRRRFRRQ